MARLEYPRILQHVAAGNAEALFELAASRIGTAVGFRLFTILIPDISGTCLQRVYSTDEAGYPLGPADEVRKSIWFRQLFENRQPIIAANSKEIAAWLPDFDGYVGTNLGSLVNYPVVVSDETVGVISLMDSPNRYGKETAHKLEREMLLAAIAIATFLRPNKRQ